MLTFSAFGTFKSVCAEYVPHAEKIRVSSNDANLVFYLDSQQAVRLRDALSRAIVEAAQKSAQAKAEVTA